MNREAPQLTSQLLGEAADALRRGRCVGFSTDTVWGLGADPRQQGAVERLYELKGREASKALQVLCASREVARDFCAPPPELEEAWERASALWPGALTLVVSASRSCPPWLTRDGKVGLRVPDSREALELLNVCGGALAASSLNSSGESPAATFEQATALNLADLVLPGEDAPGVASTVFDLGARRVLREGDLLAALRKVLP